MDELIARVSAAIGVDADLARTAIGHVLAFLQKELPDGPVAEFLDKVGAPARRLTRLRARKAAAAAFSGDCLAAASSALPASLTALAST